MKIKILNTSSPGASFTDNTNNVLTLIYEWINEHPDSSLPFREFRYALEREKHINDNNLRNINPLAKNCGFIRYESRGDLNVNQFFTNRGLAYVKALLGIRMIQADLSFTREQRVGAENKFRSILEELVFEGLCDLLALQGVNYVPAFGNLISFLIQFGKIDKTEFAVFLYYLDQGEGVSSSSLKKTIDDYRNGLVVIEAEVNVRNDIEIREKSNIDRRNEDLGYLTSYGYFISLLQQAGIIDKEENYYVLSKEKIAKAHQLLGGWNNE